jgi:hypothetical protein
MAGKTGKCVTDCDLGKPTHHYWHGSDTYWRQPLDNKTIGAIEFWNGKGWERAISGQRPLPNAANGELSLTNAVSIAHTP